MKLLKTISDQDFDSTSKSCSRAGYRTRQAARAIVFDDEGKIAILSVTKKSYHKLPGGGIEKGEDIMTALKREAKEEIGCEIKGTGEVGQIDECRDEFELLQTSYCYTAKVVGAKKQPQFTIEEAADGFEIMWVDPTEAVSILSADQPDDYEGKFILMRDLAFLNQAII